MFPVGTFPVGIVISTLTVNLLNGLERLIHSYGWSNMSSNTKKRGYHKIFHCFSKVIYSKIPY